MSKILCLIPSYNEEKAIGGVVRAVRALGHDVLVVDDGSKDRTGERAREAGAEVLVNLKNTGKGASLCKAIRLATERDHDVVLIMDGDGQHLPEDIGRLLEALDATGAGLVIGNRMANAQGMPPLRWFTNALMSWLLSRLVRQTVADTQCGFRAVRMDVLRRLTLKTCNFEIESEMILEASRQGVRIASAPITTVYDGQASSIHPWRDTLRFIHFLREHR